jgi:hypothetical protein
MFSGLLAKMNSGLNACQHAQEQAQRPSNQPSGKVKDTNLKVNIPPAAFSSTSSQLFMASCYSSRFENSSGSSAQAARKALKVGLKVAPNASLKASLKLREYHAYVGNLDLGASFESIRMFIEENKIPIILD